MHFHTIFYSLQHIIMQSTPDKSNLQRKLEKGSRQREISGFEKKKPRNKEKLCLMYSVVLFIQLTVEMRKKASAMYSACTSVYFSVQKQQSFVNIQKTVVKCILTQRNMNRTDMSCILQKKKKIRIPLLQNDSLFCFD